MTDGHESGKRDSRRSFLSWIMMFTGLLAGYGAGALHFFEYLVPIRQQRQRREMFIGTLDSIPAGSTRTVRDPKGQGIIISRTGHHPEDASKGFRALSTKCPHLGCSVHWEPGQGRYRCPCHEGIFDKDGRALSGPPAQEGKNLLEYEVRVEEATGWVFVMIASELPYGA